VFGWTAGANSERPHPYINLAQITQDLPSGQVSLTGWRDIWSPEHAWAVPTLGSNARGRLAMACAWGGGRHFVSHAVGFPQLPFSRASGYDHVTTATGSKGAPRWGDFISLRNHDERDDLFIGTGYTTHASASDPNTASATARYVVFGEGG
jgi:hypothetical protein